MTATVYVRHDDWVEHSVFDDVAAAFALASELTKTTERAAVVIEVRGDAARMTRFSNGRQVGWCDAPAARVRDLLG